jgi:hypothetical protein
MTGRVKWSRISSRKRIHRQGVEDKAKTPFGNEPPKARRKLSKAELREQAEAAFLAGAQARAQATKAFSSRSDQCCAGRKKHSANRLGVI